MSRVQLALNVSDLDLAISFYSKLFGTGPAKVRPGYDNFAIADPPLKLVLIEGQGTAGSLNHLGVEVGSTEEVGAAQRRLSDAGLATAVEDQVSCCYAVQDKVWVDGSDGEPWEIYTVLAPPRCRMVSYAPPSPAPAARVPVATVPRWSTWLPASTSPSAPSDPCPPNPSAGA